MFDIVSFLIRSPNCPSDPECRPKAIEVVEVLQAIIEYNIQTILRGEEEQREEVGQREKEEQKEMQAESSQSADSKHNQSISQIENHEENIHENGSKINESIQNISTEDPSNEEPSIHGKDVEIGNGSANSAQLNEDNNLSKHSAITKSIENLEFSSNLSEKEEHFSVLNPMMKPIGGEGKS